MVASARLFDVADVVFGFPFASSLFNERGEGMPLIRIRDLAQGRCSVHTTQVFSSEYVVSPGDLLIGMDGEFRPYVWRAGSALLNQRVCKVIPHDGPEMVPYLRAALVPALAAMEQAKSGTTVIHLNKADLARIEVPWPAPGTRLAIGGLLGSLDDKIELNRRMNETLEAIARAIFKSWFVDFDPVRAKMAGREPFGMAPATAALFPESFQDSPLGKIPAGWAVGSMRDVVSLSRASIRPADWAEELFDHYSIPAFDEGRIPVRERGSAIRSNKFLIGQDVVLLSKLNPRFPRVWLPYPGPERRAVASTEFLVATAKPGFSREYVYSLLSSDEFINRFAGLVTGTSGSHQRVKAEDFLNVSVVLPHPRLVESFTALTKPLFRRSAANIRESETLTAIRDALLPRLIAGESRLPRDGYLAVFSRS